jgi:hypothetical protein
MTTKRTDSGSPTNEIPNGAVQPPTCDTIGCPLRHTFVSSQMLTISETKMVASDHPACSRYVRRISNAIIAPIRGIKTGVSIMCSVNIFNAEV